MAGWLCLLLDAQLYHVAVLEDVVAAYHLPVICGTAPHAGRLQVLEEILVDLAGELRYGAPFL